MGHRQRGQAEGIGAQEAIFLVLVAAATWAGSEFGARGSTSPWFERTSFGVPLHYLLFGFLLVTVSPYVLAAPSFPLVARLRHLKVLPSLALAWAVLVIAIAVAIVRGVPELFADWRNLLVTAVTAVVASRWLAAQEWKRHALIDVAIAYGLLGVPLLISFATGSGTTLFGVRITVFESTPLYLSSFSAITAAWILFTGDEHLGQLRKMLLRIAGVSSSLVVLLSFRRSHWLVWGIGLTTALFIYLRRGHMRPIRVYVAALSALTLIIASFLTLGTETVISRLGSFLPGNAGDFSATNTDHVNDLVDAWSIIEDDPILGFGIGRRYETNLISDWKTDSFEVHNALLHVWLKFGIAGAIAYLLFHVALIRAAVRNTNVVPIGAFFVGELVATMAGTWPYGLFQMSVFHGLAIAIIVVESSQQRAVPLSTIRSGAGIGLLPGPR